MDFLESATEAIASLAANKLRSALTMLGVIIGVAAVIALVSLGQGVEVYIKDAFSGIGTNLIAVRVGKTETRGQGPPAGSPPRRLTMEDVRALRMRTRYLRAVTPIMFSSATVEHESFARSVNVFGVDHQWSGVFNIDAEVGRFLSETDVTSDRRVVVLGRTVWQELFGTRNPVGATVNVGGSRFRVIGVTGAKGSTLGLDFDDVVYLSAPFVQQMNGQSGLHGIRARATSEEVIDLAAQEIRTILTDRHRQEDFSVETQAELFKTLGKILAVLTVFLAGIAAISLLVGGIGIMNIMLVTVRERTREIGVRMALGARRRDILAQFLIESVLLATIGGSIGIALGTAGPHIVHLLVEEFPAVTSLWSVVLAFVFSFAVGVVFGVFPAVQAAKLDPIEALRYQ
ncbi:MAG: ABC transporter permease [Myxococcota bacterium]